MRCSPSARGTTLRDTMRPVWRSWLTGWQRLATSRSRAKPPARPDGPVLRVVSWNVRHGTDAWDRLDLAAVAAVLAGCHADVIVLQEVDRHWGERSGDVDQARWLADRLDMHGLHGWTVRRQDPAGGAERRYGNALLSRRPWSSPRVVRFREVPVLERRGLVAATTETPLGLARVVGTQLSARGSGFRRAEVGQVLTVVAHDMTRQPALPVVLAGASTPSRTASSSASSPAR